MPIDTALRFEMKLACESEWLPQARAWIRLHPEGFVVAYPPRRVNTLYFDTPHLSSLNANLEGLCVREKLRLRWYGSEMARIRPCLEIKQKDNLLGRKRRYEMSCDLDLAQSWTDVLEVIRTNAEPLFEVVLQTMSQPTLLTRYQREYYVTPDGLVRATIDCDQMAYDQRLTARPNLDAPLHIPELVVIEVKGGQDHAERIWEIVNRFPIPRSRNSKYAIGMLTAFDSV